MIKFVNVGGNMVLITLLTDELERRKGKNRSYSLRAFANSLEISSPHLCQLLLGKRSFKRDVVDKIVKALNIDSEDLDHIEAELSAEELVKKKLKDIIDQAVYQELEDKPISASDYLTVCHWHYDAIFHLIHSGSLELQTQRITKKLNLPLERVEYCIENLIKAKVVEISDDQLIRSIPGYYMQGGNYEMNMEQLRSQFQQSQEELFSRAIESFIPNSGVPNMFTTQAYRIALDQVEMVKSMILDLSNQIEKTVRYEEDEEKRTEIFFFNSQLFSVTSE